MTVIAVLTSGENGAASLVDINNNFAALNTGKIERTPLSATETPDGNRTVFTFSSATAQPEFIVSDNAMMRATPAVGSANWTWNSGTNQATMTIPPSSDIIALP